MSDDTTTARERELLAALRLYEAAEDKAFMGGDLRAEQEAHARVQATIDAIAAERGCTHTLAVAWADAQA